MRCNVMNVVVGFFVVVAFFGIAGCGSGGADSPVVQGPQSSTAEGMWDGTTNSGSKILGFVLDDGSYYAVYTDPNSTYTSGVVIGNGNSQNGTYSASNTLDFYFGTSPYISSASVTGSYTSMQTFNGSLKWANNTSVTFNSTYDTRYNQTPSLAAIAGTYNGEIVAGSSTIGPDFDSSQVVVNSNGSVSGKTALGCNYSGSVTPRSHGNIYNINILMGPSPCDFAGQNLTGMAFYSSDNGNLIAMAPSANRSGGFLILGSRQ